MSGDLHDRVSERQCLALVLSGVPEVQRGFLAIPADAWGAGTHNVVATVLRDRIVRSIPINALSVAEDAAALAGTDHKAGQVRALVVDMIGTEPPVASFEYYAETVLAKMFLRRVQAVGHRIVQTAESASDGSELADVVGTLRSHLDEIETGFGLGEPDKPISLAALLAQREEPYDWLIPGLLERTDRLILTGFEGTGKSSLLTQMGLALAAGLHPFSGMLCEDKGFRVLLLDCENSRRQIRRRWGGVRGRVDRLRANADAEPVDWDEQVRMVIRPEGVNLADPAEYARVEQAIALTAPDVVLGGPVYKMSTLDVRDEPAAKALVDALDRLRVKYNFALVVEAHVGHVGESQGGRKLRPTGSSVFLRWPEFGMGMKAHPEAAGEEHPSLVEFVAWRGSRDERDWPDLLGHSKRELPWTPRNPGYRKRHNMPEWQSEHIPFTERGPLP